MYVAISDGPAARDDAAGDVRRHKRLGAAVLGAVSLLALTSTLSYRASSAERSISGEDALVAQRSSSFSLKMSLYKRTFSSTQPLWDSNFMRNSLGLEIDTSQIVYENATGGSNETLCARRTVLSSLDSFQVHFFQSFVSPAHSTLAKWIDSWSSENGKALADSEDWTVFALPSMTFYSPYIVPFLNNLDARGTEHARYMRTAASGTILYSVLITIPYSGLTVELVSDQNITAAESREYEFSELSGKMCPPSFTIRQQTDVLYNHWKALGGTESNSRGLPDIVVVSLGFPTDDPSAMSTYLSEMLKSSGIDLPSETYESNDCDITEVEVVATATTTSGELSIIPVYLKSVKSTLAAQGTGSYTISALSELAVKTHEEFMDSSATGWDVFMDMHPGLHADVDIDGLVASLEKAGYVYNMHPSCSFCSTGSVWSSGANPWSMEIQGTFANSSTIGQCSLIDYCSSTSSGDTQDNINEISRRL